MIGLDAQDTTINVSVCVYVYVCRSLSLCVYVCVSCYVSVFISVILSLCVSVSVCVYMCVIDSNKIEIVSLFVRFDLLVDVLLFCDSPPPL